MMHTKKQYREANEERIQMTRKELYEANKERIQEKFECVCGCSEMAFIKT
jgi:hypothetical protein